MGELLLLMSFEASRRVHARLFGEELLAAPWRGIVDDG